MWKIDFFIKSWQNLLKRRHKANASCFRIWKMYFYDEETHCFWLKIMASDLEEMTSQLLHTHLWTSLVHAENLPKVLISDIHMDLGAILHSNFSLWKAHISSPLSVLNKHDEQLYYVYIQTDIPSFKVNTFFIEDCVRFSHHKKCRLYKRLTLNSVMSIHPLSYPSSFRIMGISGAHIKQSQCEGQGYTLDRGQLKVTNWPKHSCFGLWEQTRVPEENPLMLKRDMQTAPRKVLRLAFDLATFLLGGNCSSNWASVLP